MKRKGGGGGEVRRRGTLTQVTTVIIYEASLDEQIKAGFIALFRRRRQGEDPETTAVEEGRQKGQVWLVGKPATGASFLLGAITETT